MSTSEIIDFYQKIRKSPELVADLSAQPDADALVARVAILANAQGYEFTEETIRAAVDQMDAIVTEAAGDDMLTDEELAVVAAGMGWQCCGGASYG